MSLLAPQDYLARVLDGLAPLAPVDEPLHRAHGLVLAEDVAASVAVPPWTNSAMDGYAVRAQEVGGASAEHPVRLPVAGDVPAGREPRPLEPGTAQRIMTGAMLPQGADAVVRVEDTDQSAGPGPLPAAVEIRLAPPRGANVRSAGEDLGAGAPVLAAGSVLSARALAALASVGRASVRVRPRVRVAVISTGAELRDPGAALRPGTIPDSNGLLLAGLVAEQGARCTAILRSADSPEELSARLVQAAAQADLVITSGGVSAGAFDPLTALADDGPHSDTHSDTHSDSHGPSTSGGSGESDGSGESGGSGASGGVGGPVRLGRAAVAMQPGKPQAHGWVRAEDGRQVPLLCLPGNPVSVLVSFTTIAVAVLARLGGYDRAPDPAEPAGAAPGWSDARAADSWVTPPGRRQYLPVRIVPAPSPLPQDPGAAPEEADREDPENNPEHGSEHGSGRDAGSSAGSGSGSSSGSTVWVVPSHRLGSGSHLVASLPAAQALAVVEAGVERVEVGDRVRLLPLSAPPAPL